MALAAQISVKETYAEDISRQNRKVWLILPRVECCSHSPRKTVFVKCLGSISPCEGLQTQVLQNYFAIEEALKRRRGIDRYLDEREGRGAP